MRQRLLLVLVFAEVAVVGQARAAAPIEPLVVVVETTPGAGMDPGEVRRTIAAELRTPVRAPRDGADEEASDVLIVTVDRAEIRMSLRPYAAGIVSRTVRAPTDRKARLQSIGWLAGNLARDQVNPLLAAAPIEPVVEAAPALRTEVPPAPSPATEPPRFAKNEVRPNTPESGGVAVARSSPVAASDGPRWSLALGGGPTALWSWTARSERGWPGPGIWSLELHRRSSANGLILGAALDVGPDMMADLLGSPTNFMGLAALVGVTHSLGRPFVEATGGLGVEAYEVAGSETTTTSETGTTTTTTAFAASRLGLYLRGQVSAGLTLSRYFDLLANFGGHLGNLTRFDHFLTTGLAVRCHFPR